MNLKLIFGPSKTVLKKRLSNLESAYTATSQHLYGRRMAHNPKGEWSIPVVLNTPTKGLSKAQIKVLIDRKKSELQYLLNDLARMTSELVKRSSK